MKKKLQSKKLKDVQKKDIGKSKIFLIFVFFVSLAISIFVHDGQKYNVVISDSGFNPDEITIPEGATVTWISEGKLLHWPASNNHPLHTIYPDGGGCIGSKLDACRGLKKGESFSFKFDSVGSWGMHDHNNAANTMTVIVKEKQDGVDFWINGLFNRKKDSNKLSDSRERVHLQWFSERQKPLIKYFFKKISSDQAAAQAQKICSDLNGSKFREEQHCYQEVFYFITKNNDQKFAFDTVASLNKGRSTLMACHLISHGIGNGLYDKDPEKWQDAIGKASPECSYGEIHGILEGYGSSGNNPFERKKLPLICAKNPNWACFHGLGHVLIAVEGDNINKAAELCYVFSGTPKDNCINGVFMEHMVGQVLEQHGLVTAERRKRFYDHLPEFEELCALQTSKDYIRACWTEIIHASVAKLRGNVQEIYAICDKSQTPQGDKGCRIHALAELIPNMKYDPYRAQYICKIPDARDPKFEQECYVMIASVIMANTPSKIDLATNFCSTLDKEFEPPCMDAVKRSMVLLQKQDKEKADEVCKNVSDQNNPICNDHDGELVNSTGL